MDGITDSREHEFKQTEGDGEGQGSLAGCSPWGRQEVDTTEQLNTDKRGPHQFFSLYLEA